MVMELKIFPSEIPHRPCQHSLWEDATLVARYGVPALHAGAEVKNTEAKHVFAPLSSTLSQGF